MNTTKTDRIQRTINQGLAYLRDSVEQGQSDKLRAYLDAQARFRNYSFRNTLLILRQLIRRNAIWLEYVQNLGGPNGCSSGDHIRIARALTPAMEFAVLVHEFAHKTARNGKEGGRNKTAKGGTLEGTGQSDEIIRTPNSFIGSRTNRQLPSMCRKSKPKRYRALLPWPSAWM